MKQNYIVHFEIHAVDMDKMQKFYETVFDWKLNDMGAAMGNYRLIVTGDNVAMGPAVHGLNGGMTPRKGAAPAGGEPVNAYVCIVNVDDIDAYIAKVKTAGGSIAAEKMEVPKIGMLAYAKDPEGNLFGMLQPAAGM